MNKKIWIKLYLEILDDPKMGRLPDHLWKFAVQLFLLAGKKGNDGSLPPIADIAWAIRLLEEKVEEDLRSLAEVGIVHEQDNAWLVTHFQDRQKCESYDRVTRYRERYKKDVCNGEVAEDSSSTSPSKSISVSQEEVGVQGEGKQMAERETREDAGQTATDSSKSTIVPRALPSTPVEAMLHPGVRVFTAATEGRIPGLSQYRAVIDTVRLLRRRNKLDDEAMVTYLKPYWLAWSSRKRVNGQPYDPGNITWLVEWALNGFIPTNHPMTNESNQNPGTSANDRAEVIRRVAKGKT